MIGFDEEDDEAGDAVGEMAVCECFGEGDSATIWGVTEDEVGGGDVEDAAEDDADEVVGSSVAEEIACR